MLILVINTSHLKYDDTNGKSMCRDAYWRLFDLINYVNYFTPFFDDFNLIMYVVLVK